jgi:hypothetical protein
VASSADLLAGWLRDPLAFVEQAFPWGAGALKMHSGPDDWQREILGAVRDGDLRKAAFQLAIASGHGIGKSCLVAWLSLWAMLRPDTRGVVTANTANQLETKTWAELAKWHGLCVVGSLWRLTATMLVSADDSRAKTWRLDAVPWSESRTEAFAGLHNEGKRILVIYDEASAIPDIIWQTTEGALTDSNTEIMWFVFGNPTRNTGRFRECFGRFRHRWQHRQIDSRTARIANKEQIQQWVDDYGEDSDFVRVRVRGVFPRAGSMQFIPGDLVDAATKREPHATLYDPIVLGCDIARFGDDSTVLVPRRGRDAASEDWVKLRGADTMKVAARIAEMHQKFRFDAIFVDGGGVGGGVVDRLRMLKLPVIEVQFGGAPDRTSDTSEGAVCYFNKRAEIWGVMRDWLRGGAIPDDPEIVADLTGVEYGYAMLKGRDAVQLEKKSDMKKRGLASPDTADALALTFAYPVEPSDHTAVISGKASHHAIEYDYAASLRR